MKCKLTAVALICGVSSFALAENHATEAPLTMKQLMREFRIDGGNWTFHFEEPVYARITCEVAEFPDARSMEQHVFTSARAARDVSLFFMDAPSPVGEATKPNQVNTREMKFQLSDCPDTDRVRIIYYTDKFSMVPWVTQEGRWGKFKPAIAEQPELNKEYILSLYYLEGDSYEVRATVSFAKSVEDFAKIPRYERDTPRRFKITGAPDNTASGPQR